MNEGAARKLAAGAGAVIGAKGLGSMIRGTIKMKKAEKVASKSKSTGSDVTNKKAVDAGKKAAVKQEAKRNMTRDSSKGKKTRKMRRARASY